MTMRADAVENKTRVREAALAAYSERGLSVSLKEIARRAGVSHGTIYNLFGGREGLVDEVVADLIDSRLAAVVTTSLRNEDPWEAFATYVEELCGLMATDPFMADALSGRVSGTSRVAQVCEQAHEAGAQVVERARSAGVLRDDFVATDLVFLFGGQASLAPAVHAAAPGSWRRGVALALDGLRASAATPLPEPPLDRAQMLEANTRLGAAPEAAGRSAGPRSLPEGSGVLRLV